MKLFIVSISLSAASTNARMSTEEIPCCSGLLRARAAFADREIRGSLEDATVGCRIDGPGTTRRRQKTRNCLRRVFTRPRGLSGLIAILELLSLRELLNSTRRKLRSNLCETLFLAIRPAWFAVIH